MELQVDVELNGEAQLVVTTTVEIIGNLTSTNNNIHFAITLDGPDHSRFIVVAYYQQAFTQSEVGSVQIYSHNFPLDPNWNLGQIRAVSFIQSNVIPRQIYQGQLGQLTGVMPSILADLTQGPPTLIVNFRDISFSSYDILSWAWDFNQDGIIDSTTPNGTWSYNTVGSHPVWLTITTELGESTAETIVTVVAPEQVSGSVAGKWTEEYSPYFVRDDIEIPAGRVLEIGAGVDIQIAEGVKINILGVMEAKGELNKPILFTSPAGWGGITISSNTFPSSFSYTHFEKAVNTVISSNNTTVSLANCVFMHNSSPFSDAVLSFHNVTGVMIKGSFFANNQSTGTNKSGVIGLNASTIKLENSILVNNTGTSAGVINALNNSVLQITNSTIYHNENTNVMGSTLVNSTGSRITMLNSIISGNTPIFNVGGILDVTYSRIIGNSNIGNINLDPLFMNESSGIGAQFPTMIEDWILAEDSPCIDAGNPELQYLDLADPENPFLAQFPSRGGLRNDQGAFGGGGVCWVDETEQNKISVLPALKVQTYPNPFNPNLGIKIMVNDLTQPLNVTVYNLKGQKIKELVQGYSQSETLQLVWNGRDEQGQPVATGVYFIRVQVSDRTAVKKSVLIK